MYPPSLLLIPRKLLLLDFLQLQIVFLEFLIDWRRRSLLPPKSVPKSLKKLILKHLPKTMADRFDYILRDKIKRIGDRKLFLIPEDRRRVIFNVIAFCSLGDEDEAVACVNALIKLFNWTIEQFPYSIQLRNCLDDWIIHYLRLCFAHINFAVAKNPRRTLPKPFHQECINSVILPFWFFLPLCLVNKILNFDRCKFSQQNSYPLHYKAFDIVHSRLLEMANDPGTGIEEMESILVDFTAIAAVIANATYSEWQAMAMQ